MSESSGACFQHVCICIWKFPTGCELAYPSCINWIIQVNVLLICAPRACKPSSANYDKWSKPITSTTFLICCRTRTLTQLAVCWEPPWADWSSCPEEARPKSTATCYFLLSLYSLFFTGWSDWGDGRTRMRILTAFLTSSTLCVCHQTTRIRPLMHLIQMI